VAEGCVVGDWAVIDPGTVLGAVVGAGARIGARCVVHSGARLGFSCRPTAPAQSGWPKAASFGGVVVGDGVEIGPNAVIEDGETRPTTIADGVRIGALAMIGHDCSIGPGSELVAMVGLAGGVQIGVSNRVRIGDRAMVFGKSGVLSHVPDNGRYMGYPAWPRDQWLRAQAMLRHSTRRPRAARPGT